MKIIGKTITVTGLFIAGVFVGTQIYSANAQSNQDIPHAYKDYIEGSCIAVTGKTEMITSGGKKYYGHGIKCGAKNTGSTDIPNFNDADITVDQSEVEHQE